MNVTKTYFLPPNWDYPPGGRLALGSILATTRRKPNFLNILNAAERVPIPSKLLYEPMWKTGEQIRLTKKHDHTIRLWASFLHMIVRVSGDIAGNFVERKEDLYAFERMETESFEPDISYIEESMKGVGVEQYIKASRFKKHVYMVVAVTTVYGASAEGIRGNTHGINASLGIDGTPARLPISASPKVAISSSKTDSVSFGGSSPFVFAFRLRKIRYTKDNKSFQQRDYIEGAMLGTDEAGQQDNDLYVEILGLEERDTSGDEFGLAEKAIVVDDDGEELCACVPFEKN